MRKKCFSKIAEGVPNLIFRNKSDLFLLAYLIFLLVTLCFIIFKIDYNRNIINAVIITGMIFSLAELFYSLDAIKKDSLRLKIDAETIQVQALLKMQKECNETFDRITKALEENYSVLFCEEFQPREEYSETEKLQIIKEINEKKKQALEAREEHKKNIEAHYAGREETRILVEALRESIHSNEILLQRDPIFANIIMCFGILIFLVLLEIDKSIAFSDKVNTIITIMVFIMLVLNYYIKQIYTNIISEDIKSYKIHAQYFLTKRVESECDVKTPPVVPHKVYSKRNKK